MDREDSRNSSEEVLDHYSDNDLGVGRSYECVFCKRGFNTAQALGGHMNIHRKDRARNKPNSTTKQPPRFHPSSSSEIPRFSPQPHLAYFPAAADATNSTLYESTDPGRQQPADPRDWRMRLSLEFAPLDHRRAMGHDKELDLELRLGYDS